MAEPSKLRQKPLWGDVTMAVMTVENGSWQVEKIDALNSRNVEKGISRTQFYNYVVEKLGKQRRECRKMTPNFNKIMYNRQKKKP